MLFVAEKHPFRLAAFAGVLLAFSFPPIPLAFVALGALVPLIWLLINIQEQPTEPVWVSYLRAGRQTVWNIIIFTWLRKKATIAPKTVKSFSALSQLFLYSYTSFFIWNLLCCYWLILTALSAPDLTEAIISALAGLAAVVLNPLVMTIPILVWGFLRKFITNQLLSLWLLLPFWLTFEYLHFRWDLTWPWLTLGNAFAPFPYYVQYYEFTGVLGGSALIWISNLLIVQFMVFFDTYSSRKIFIRATILLTLWLIPFISNFWILDENRDVFKSNGYLNVRVIQPNIDPYQKFQVLTPEQQIARLCSLTTLHSLSDIDLVVWPETAIPEGILRDQFATIPLLAPVRKIIEENPHISLATGLVEYHIFRPKGTPPASARPYSNDLFFELYNSVAIMNGQGDEFTYQKAKLVPLIERMPFLESLNFLKKFHIDLGGNFGNCGYPDSLFCLKTFTGVPVAFWICYESVFGDHTRKFAQKGAQLACIITNDGWWKQSSGYIQHRYHSTLRSIEIRRCIARSANTGTSLFTDNQGNITQMSQYDTPAVLDNKLLLYQAQTVYTQIGDWIGVLASGITLLSAISILGYQLIKPSKKT